MRNQTVVYWRSRAALATAAVLALVPSAGAATTGSNRAASKTEAAGVARSAGFPARCLAISVSADDEQWAAWDFKYPVHGSCRTLRNRALRANRIQDEQLTFVRRSGRTWRRVAAVGDCGRPGRVPASVYRDLGPVSCVSGG